jgi:hypothetical protein
MTAIETFPPFGPLVRGENRPKLTSAAVKRTGHIYRDCSAVDLVVKKGRKVAPCEVCMADHRDISDRARAAQQEFDRKWMAEHAVHATVEAAAVTVASPIAPERSIEVEPPVTAAQVRKLMVLYRIDQPHATYVAIKNAELRAKRMTFQTASDTITKLERKHGR